jgi:hypothetical protein
LTANVNNTYASLTWNPVPYAQSYDVEYKADADINWTVAGNTTGTTINLTGLNVTTLYYWRVKTNCSFGGSGFTQSQFTTLFYPCETPTGLNTTFSPGLVTTMAWNPAAGALRYYVQLKWTYQVWPAYELDSTVNVPAFPLVGLMSGLTLDWRVATVCDSSNSNYAVSQFTTPIPPPSSISTTGITGNSAIINWTAPADSYNTPFGYTVQYKLSTSSTWISTNAVPTTTLTKTLTGLAPGKTYDVRVRLNGYSVNSTYVQTSFSTPCNIIPSGLTHTTVSPTSGTVKWNAISGAVSYNLQYKKSTVTTWTTISGITTSSYNLTGLTANTIYNYQVQMVCTAGTSAYSSPSSFTTYCTSSGTNNQEWIDYFKFGTMERYGISPAPGGYFNAASTYVPLNVTIGTSGIAGIISAGYSGSTRNEYYAIYIDFNRNGNFTDPGEKVAGQTAMTNGNYYNFTVNIPLTATPGITAIRAVMLRQPTTVVPCLTGSRGETNDFYLNLIAPAAFSETTEPVIVKNEEAPQSTILVAPNPSSGRFKVFMPQGDHVMGYEIFNNNGGLVMKKTMNMVKLFDIDITHLPNGLYLLKTTDQSGRQQICKLLKN